eukprot:SAG11_NODE_2386_length_3418_cov_1.215728_7_plen_42_part_01
MEIRGEVAHGNLVALLARALVLIVQLLELLLMNAKEKWDAVS